MDFFTMKNGNVFYIRKVLGSETWWVDKLIFGYLFGGILLTLMVGPFIFFSDIGGFIQPNPVSTGDISIDFVINKRESEQELKEFGLLNRALNNDSAMVTQAKNVSDDNINDKLKDLYASRPYLIYENKNPFLRQYDNEFLQ